VDAQLLIDKHFAIKFVICFQVAIAADFGLPTFNCGLRSGIFP
jgi:hypothetical protein